MREKVLIIGAANMDFTMQVRSMPAAGETAIEESRFHYAAGGNGAAAAMAILRLGGDPVYVAKVGADVHGHRLLRLYAEAGMDITHVAVDGHNPTGMRVIMKEDNGDSRVVVYPGANANLLSSDAERAVADAGPGAVFLQTELPADVLIGTARMAEARGIPLFLDSAGVSADFPFASLPNLEILFIDDKDTLALTGIMPIGSDSCLKAAVELEKRVKAHHYLIKLNGRGIFAYDGRYCHMILASGLRAGESKPICDEACAAILLEYRRNGGDVQGACRFGLSLNTLLAKNNQDAAYFPTEEEVRAFSEKH
ncbi:MAG: hypothetical protein IJ009_01805 [Clostridia bacterium]|nr:hypothetical protein [Clostridia bacterium]